MSVQPVDHDPADIRVADIPCTIASIGAALSSPVRRMAFYAEVMAAPAGAEIDQVMRRWRAEALLDRAGRHPRRPSGRRVSLDELAAPLGGLAAL